MAIEGPLRELGIHDVFQLLDLSRKTGVLRITSQVRRNQGTVWFDGGAIVYAEIKSNPHPLGGLLLRAARITEADLQMARDLQGRGDPRRLGDILVSAGAITRRELERQVRFQVEEVIFEVVGWQEGYFSFHEGPLTGLNAEAAVRIPTEALLMEGARRIDEWSRIERWVPHVGVVPVLAGEDGGEGGMDLLPPEWEVLALIDGQRSVRGIAQELGRSEFDVAKTVFGLASAAVLRVDDRGGKATRAAPAATDIQQAISRVETALVAHDLDGARAEAEALAHAHPDDARACVVLGRVMLAQGQLPEGEEATRRALKLDPLLAAGHRQLGDALLMRGRFAEAAEWWRRWLTVDALDAGGGIDRVTVEAAVAAVERLDAYLRGLHGG